MTALALATAFRSMLVLSPGSYTWAHHPGEVTSATATPPWLVSNVSIPDGRHRSDAATRVAGDVDVYLTAAGRTEAEVSLILETQQAALDGVAPVVAGYVCGAFVEYQRPRTYPSDFVLGGTTRHLWVGVVGYRTTVSPA